MALDQPGGGGDGDWWWRWTEHANVYLLRPLLAVFFVLCLIVLSWFIAWKTVLVHVPLVQEIFGLRKKPVKPKPRNSHRLSRFYNSNPDLSIMTMIQALIGLFDMKAFISDYPRKQTIDQVPNRKSKYLFTALTLWATVASHFYFLFSKLQNSIRKHRCIFGGEES